MKHTSEIHIELPLDAVIKKFDNAENMRHWQRGLVSIEHLSGIPGMVGSKMKLNYKINQREMKIIETITHRNLPKELHGTYSANGIDNIQENYFEEIENGTTKWISMSNYLPLNFTMTMMLWLMPASFKKQSKRYMSDFKKFAEKGISVVHEKT